LNSHCDGCEQFGQAWEAEEKARKKTLQQEEAANPGLAIPPVFDRREAHLDTIVIEP